MKEIQLSKGFVALVDDEDYERVSAFKWCATVDYNGYVRAGRTERSNGKNRNIKLHRFILNAVPGDIVDHIDGNPLNNQKHNLRLCDKSQNGFNRKIGVNNKTGYKGVFLVKKNNKYAAVVTLKGKTYRIGLFDSATDAALAYDKKALELFGEFARTNFLDNGNRAA